MSKIKLGDRPKSFKRIVKFPRIEGGEGAIECTFKYRTRKEFGEFLDRMVEAAGPKTKPDDEKFSMASLFEKTGGQNAQYIMDVLDAWNLDVDLSLSAVEQLSNEYPGAASAIMEAYRMAIVEGRLGN
ncbi:phage tail assembly chaperone [Acidovorax sp. Root568]|uniref:phage tail assembly chaperone n=1 Tax=Acidovorax sp. Root568 TaxID=1736565 RepID=UPI0006F8A3A2|nr:phage tail assembly chaperone [Acidovorax sp. Root568]KRA13953.1 hypothetical protein ASD75_04635 [Acidovorax sp. Root568]